MPTRITVISDCNLAFLPAKRGGGFRKAGYVVDVVEDMPNSLRLFKDRSTFFSALQTGYIRVEYIAKAEHVVTPAGGYSAPNVAVAENVFKRGADEDSTNKNVVGGVDLPTKELDSDVTVETVEEGDPNGGIVATSVDSKYLSDVVVPTTPAASEADVIDAVAEVEEVVESGDDTYAKVAEEKPYKEEAVSVPEGDEEYVLEAETANVTNPDPGDIVTFLEGKGLSRRVAKSAAKIYTDNIVDAKACLALYGVNEDNLSGILEHIEEYKTLKG